MWQQLVKGYEDRFGSAYISILFVFVSIIPAIILFWLVDSTGEIILKESQYIQTAKFGGAFAGFLITFFMLMWQHKNVSKTPNLLVLKGTVLDSENNIIQGVTIRLEGDTRSTITDFNGYFSLELNTTLKEWCLIVQYDGQSELKPISKNEINQPIRIVLKKKSR